MVNLLTLKELEKSIDTVLLLQVVVESLSTEDDTLLKCLIDLAESTPKYLRHQLEIVFNLCLKVCTFWSSFFLEHCCYSKEIVYQ